MLWVEVCSKSPSNFIWVQSIHLFSIPTYPRRATRGLVPFSSSQWVRGEVHPGQVACPSQVMHKTGFEPRTFLLLPTAPPCSLH